MTDYIATFFVTSILDEDPDHVICKAHVAAERPDHGEVFYLVVKRA